MTFIVIVSLFSQLLLANAETPSTPCDDTLLVDTTSDPGAIADAATQFTNQWAFFARLDDQSGYTAAQLKESYDSFVAEFRAYQRRLESHLKRIGVEFEWREFPSLQLKKLIGKEQTLFITPGTRSPLNRLAKHLEESYGVGLIYDQVSLRKYMGQAAYHPWDKVLYLDAEAAYSRYPDEIESILTEHEIVHVESDAYRSGLTEDLGNHQLQCTFKMAGFRFHGDELLAYAVNIRKSARAVMMATDPKKAAKASQMLDEAVRHSREHAAAILVVTQKIVDQKLIERSSFKLRMDGNQVWIDVGRVHANSTSVFVHPMEMDDFRKNQMTYLKRRLLHAQTHAQFTLDYLDNSPKESPDFHSKMVAYQAAQARLVQQLKK